MTRQEKTFLFPVNCGSINGGELQIVCSKISNALKPAIETISYRPNVHSHYANVTNLIEFTNTELWDELSELAKQQFEEPEEDEEYDYRDTVQYHLNEIAKGHL